MVHLCSNSYFFFHIFCQFQQISEPNMSVKINIVAKQKRSIDKEEKAPIKTGNKMKQLELNGQGRKLYEDHQSSGSIIPQNDQTMRPNISSFIDDDILVLKLSDKLINATYHLSVMKIQLAIQKVCVLQRLFVQKMAWGLEGIMLWGNREYKKTQGLDLQHQILSNGGTPTNGIIQTFKQRQRLIVLTRQQQQQKVFQEVRDKLGRMVMILHNKKEKQMYHALCQFQSPHNNQTQPLIRKPARNKFQTVIPKQVPYIRRSIEKDPSIKRTTHQPFSFSLNKGYQSSLGISSKVSIKNNYYFTERKMYGANICATKSTCSQSSVCQDTAQYDTSNNYTTKHEKELSTLRTKYNKLVQQFHQFSQRFLSVIREE